MNKKSIKTLTLIIIVIVFSSLCLINESFAGDSIKIIVQGEEIDSVESEKIYIDSNNKVIVPIRFILEKIGYEVSWNDSNKTVYAKKNNDNEIHNISIKTTIWDIITSLGVAIGSLTGAFGGVWTYNLKNNRELYRDRLREVYGPLYKHIAKQEFIRKTMLPDSKIEDVPILDARSEQRIILDREIFIKIVTGVNQALASPRLVSLIGLYEAAIAMEEILPKDKIEWKKSTITKVKIELDIYEEVIRGYLECIKKLRLDKNYNIKKNRLIIDYSVTQQEIEELEDLMKQNSEA